MNTIPCKSLAAFDYSLTGRDHRPVKAGDSFDCAADHVPGLVGARLVEPADDKGKRQAKEDGKAA